MTAIDIPFLVSQLGHHLIGHEEGPDRLIFEIEVAQGANKGENTWPTV
jgi:hypothetical protein